MKHSRLFATAVLLFIPIITIANAVDSTSHQQQVETLFRLTQMEKKVQDSVTSVVQLEIRRNPQLAQHRKTVFEFFAKHNGWSALKDDLTAMYISKFTEKELKEINAFYITPTGQKVIKVLPELVQQRNQLAMQRLQQNIGELQQNIGVQNARP